METWDVETGSAVWRKKIQGTRQLSFYEIQEWPYISLLSLSSHLPPTNTWLSTITQGGQKHCFQMSVLKILVVCWCLTLAAGAGVSLKREKHFLPVTELTDKAFGLTQLKNTIETRTVKHSQTLSMYTFILLFVGINEQYVYDSKCSCLMMYSWTNLTHVYVSDSRLHQCFRYGTELTLFYPDEVMHWEEV